MFNKFLEASIKLGKRDGLKVTWSIVGFVPVTEATSVFQEAVIEVLRGKATLPYKLVAPLLQKIEKQVNDQMKPPEEPNDQAD